MCRQNLLWGTAALAFGMGVLLGTWLQSGLLAHLLGFALLLLGVAMIRRH